jgi:hypothetical protein
MAGREEISVKNTRAWFRCSAAAVLLLVVVMAIACSPAGSTNAPATPPLTVEALKNAQYQGIYDQPVTLTDGQYEGPPFVEGGASRPTVTFIEPYALGDLDGDGAADAAVLLVENSGGSGSFVYLAAVLDRGGSPDNVATALLGDRLQPQSLAITKGRIDLQVIGFGPNDPLCCPTQQEEQTYALQDGQLVQTSSQILNTPQP